MPPGSLMSKDHRLSPVSKSDSVRARDNQRRSRARRKEYIQELETKLRKCETLGVQASVDIQSAARSVADDNARLREDNARLRGENDSLKEMLRQNETRAALCAAHDRRNMAVAHDGLEDASKRRATRVIEIPLEAPKPDPNNENHIMARASPNKMAPSSNPCSSKTVFGVGSLQDNTICGQPDTLELTASSHSPTQSTSPGPNLYDTQSGRSLMGDDTTSCEYAAQIIASMRADVSSEEIRADLGCGNSVQELRQCKVGNSKLFLAMDRYAG